MDYLSRRWKQKSKHILKLDKYKDQILLRKGITREAKVVHHIYPAEEFPEFQWEDWNLISVSLGTHNRLEDRANGKLTAEGLVLQNRTRIGEDWRKHGHQTKP